MFGPLLFLIYYKDIPTVTAMTALFPDDTLLFHPACHGSKTSPCCPLQANLDALSSWPGCWPQRVIQSSQTSRCPSWPSPQSASSRMPGNHVHGNGLPATFVPGQRNVCEGYWAAQESLKKKLLPSLFHYFLNVKSTSQILRAYLTGKEKPVREAQH